LSLGSRTASERSGSLIRHRSTECQIQREARKSPATKRNLSTILEVMEIWNEVQRIKKDVNTYKFKGNLASRALWSKVEMLGNIPDRTGESMRNFFKQWKSKTITQSLEKIWDEKKMRFA
jgi:hypothetical protein